MLIYEGYMLLYSLFKILRFSAEYFSFIKYSLKNFRVLDIYQTKLIEHDKNFEPNFLSFSLLNHQL